MKKLIFIIVALLIVLNTFVGFILSNYVALNFLLTDLSLALSAGLLYFVVSSKMTNGFKIGLTVLLLLTGIVRCLCVAFADQTWANNYCFIAAIGILLFELACVASGLFASKKKAVIKQQMK